MTFPSLRRVLLAVPLTLAATMAGVACEPPPRPGGTTACVTGYPMVAPLPPATASVPQAVPACPPATTSYIAPTQSPAMPPPLAPHSSTGNSTWTMFVQQDKLHVETSDGMKANCERMSILVTGVDPVEVARSGQQLRLTSGKDTPGGTFLQATADRVTRIGVDGATLVLEGNAKLTCVRLNKKAELSADRVSINVVSGQIISDMGMTQPIPVLTPSTPCMPTTPTPSVTPTTGSSTYKPESMGWFHVGFFR